MRRRKIIVALVALLGLGAFTAWRMVHRCDPRLSGRWLVMFSQPATEQQIRDAGGRITGLASANWTLHPDGTGRENLHYFLEMLPQVSAEGTVSLQAMSRPMPTWMPSLQSCRWWTEDDRLIIDWGSDATGWQWMQAVAINLFTGTVRSSRVEEYSYKVEQPHVIRIESHAEGQQVYYMTRIDQG